MSATKCDVFSHCWGARVTKASQLTKFGLSHRQTSPTKTIMARPPRRGSGHGRGIACPENPNHICVERDLLVLRNTHANIVATSTRGIPCVWGVGVAGMCTTRTPLGGVVGNGWCGLGCVRAPAVSRRRFWGIGGRSAGGRSAAKTNADNTLGRGVCRSRTCYGMGWSMARTHLPTFVPTFGRGVRKRA